MIKVQNLYLKCLALLPYYVETPTKSKINN